MPYDTLENVFYLILIIPSNIYFFKNLYYFHRSYQTIQEEKYIKIKDMLEIITFSEI